ncbi:Fic family protein [Termitidicoccus mucosus]|uniref:Cell filamentation protein Fic n=1 Tax=Termitidicoccus mucosus TaxID=1184151 RepID=A0A178II65_9BACT|nr:cell filamentation protein Fic [Opitutaceae bacterium TSB47]
MKTRKTASSPVGRWIKTLEGYNAYHPAALPPEIAWNNRLVRILSQADQLLGRLVGEGRRLPSPHVLIRPFVRREAVFSSKIEGTQATLGELLAAEAGATPERSPEDLREVGNYVAALEFGMKRLKTLPLSLRLIRELHEKLMAGVRGDYATPGEFRRTQNWIGRPGCTLADASYVPPPPDALGEHLGRLEKFLHDESIPPLVHAALMHYQFEAIHPFLDGNGRVGRLLITLCLHAHGVLPEPLLYLSAFFEATRSDYYGSLRAVTEEGDWTGWLEYFLNGVARQSEDALSRAERINQQLTNWRDTYAGGGSKVPLQIIDLIGANPFLTPRETERRLGVAYNTIMRAIALLESDGVLAKVGESKRDRVFCARAILDILEEPARLAATPQR